MTHDYDWIVVGSGFGGSVSALRLAEKGYRVAVLECGRRFGDDDFPKSTWDLRRYFWAPRLGLRGIFRLTPFKDVAVVSGCGVGGGSLGYANTLYVPPQRLLPGPAVARTSRTGSRRSRPTTTRHSGCSASSSTTTTTRPTSCCASSARRSASATPTARPPSGSSSASPARPSPTPTSAARGPSAPAACSAGAAWSAAPTAPRTRWSRTTSGWPRGAGSRSTPDRTVTEIRPLGAADGSDGYAVTSERSGLLRGRGRRTLTAARRHRRRRGARHQQAAAALPARRLAAARLAAARRAGPDQQRGRSSRSPSPRTTPTT